MIMINRSPKNRYFLASENPRLSHRDLDADNLIMVNRLNAIVAKFDLF